MTEPATGSRPTLCHVVGARPNYVKASAVLAASAARGRFRDVLVDTGQHYDPALRDAVFADLALKEPDHHLGVGSATHAKQTAAIMIALETLLLTARPDAVVLYGDVNSTLAAALVAAKMQIPIAHVEAGLRTFDRSMPEEINRVVTDTLAELHFTPSREASAQLAREGLPPERTFFVGNVMVDTLLRNLPRARPRARTSLARLTSEGEPYALLTLHRPSNVDDASSLDRLARAVETLSRELPIVFPVHPRTRAQLRTRPAGARLDTLSNVRVTEPLGYLDFLCLQANADLVLTDSGGVQEETSVLGVPCVTLLDRTERPLTVTHGTNRLAGNDPERVLEVSRLARSQPRTPAVIEGWDGRAAERIVDQLVACFR